jgi:hypothetical protein
MPNPPPKRTIKIHYPVKYGEKSEEVVIRGITVRLHPDENEAVGPHWKLILTEDAVEDIITLFKNHGLTVTEE